MQLLLSSLVTFALASQGATGSAPPLRAAVAALAQRPLPPQPLPSRALPPLPLVPDWRHWLQLERTRNLRGLLVQPGPPPVRRLQLRWVYLRLVQLPELDRVGRFAHVDFPLPGLSGGPEVLRVAPEPPRENYPRAQEITPGWSWWYVSAERWAVGVATGTRFLISDHAGTIVDLATCEVRGAFFLP